MRRRDLNSQLMAISDTAYEAGIRRFRVGGIRRKRAVDTGRPSLSAYHSGRQERRWLTRSSKPRHWYAEELRFTARGVRVRWSIPLRPCHDRGRASDLTARLSTSW